MVYLRNPHSKQSPSEEALQSLLAVWGTTFQERFHSRPHRPISACHEEATLSVPYHGDVGKLSKNRYGDVGAIRRLPADAGFFGATNPNGTTAGGKISSYVESLWLEALVHVACSGSQSVVAFCGFAMASSENVSAELSQRKAEMKDNERRE
ncbi:hypothetical protein BDV96DRAFT_593357 [Lophiotrema nucula]|uniref:Uncharacterized protein n=1 Tax=Lophiotrema nucula TaxID=690887 RepID=A0A6A5ZUW5_9PLEO|nr:hypothetical protein BDV96DRAFT_593357 [Lophiotrema nucula]